MEGRTSGGGLKQTEKKLTKQEETNLQTERIKEHFRGAPYMSGQTIQNYSQPNAFLDPDFLRLLGDQAPLFAADLVASDSPTYQNGPISAQMQNARMGNAFTAMKERLLKERLLKEKLSRQELLRSTRSNNSSSGNTTSAARGANPFGANDNYIQEAIQRARSDKQYKFDQKQQTRDSLFSEAMDREKLRQAKLENDNYSQNEYYDLLKSILNVSRTSMVPELKKLLRR